jgi:hypothetical protein
MRGQYSSHRRDRPHPSDGSEWIAGTPARFFLCAGCRAQVVICSCCDRGQIYCADGCAQQARHSAQRAAGRRYQTSRRGRVAHALRSRNYRGRQKNVTHQGSPPPPSDDLLSLDLAAANSARFPDSFPRPSAWCCRWCGCRCPAFVRQDFLRRRWSSRSFTRRAPERDHSP